MKDFDRSILIGVIFDLSVEHNGSGIRNVDLIKEVLIKKVLDQSILSKIYVSHPNWNQIPRDQGESTYYLVSYQAPDKFSIDSLFKNTVSLIGETAEDCDKYIFLFTDRFQAITNHQYKKGFLSNNIRGYSTKICVFGIGEHYDKISLKSMAEEYQTYFEDLKDISSLSNSISKIIEGNNGK